MKSLAIEREYGSGGREIGISVAKKAGIPYYDTNLLVRAAKEYELNIGELQEYDEKKTDDLLWSILTTPLNAEDADRSELCKMRDGMKATIKKLAGEGPAVFIGRCSTEILIYHPDVVRTYIYSSSITKKINRIMKKEHVSEAEAKTLMKENDRERQSYFRFWTKKDPRDRKNYDLELNTGMFSIPECADILLYTINH